jgi:transposase
MSRKELDRLSIIQRVDRKELSQEAAAKMMSRSARQVRRLLDRYKEYGEQGLISKHRGKPSNNRLPDVLRQQIAEIVSEHYADFGPTLAQEKLLERHDIKLSVETLRQIMTQVGLWKPKRKRQPAVHQLRERRPCRGELIQIDGSPHAWFEDRGPRCTLIVFIDDATGELMGSEFWPQETTQAYMSVLQGYLSRDGRPVSFYSDKHSIFRINTETADGHTMTQFGRVLDTLNIEAIHASTPQAKGRVERMNKTLQDRLIKEMRLEGIDNIAQANPFLPIFMADFNKRFAKPARLQVDAHRQVQETKAELDLILSRHHLRVISKSLEVRFENAVYQLQKPDHKYRWAKQTATVCKHYDGRVSIQVENEVIPYKTYHLGEAPRPTDNEKTINHRVDQAIPKQKTSKPAKDNPWRNYKLGTATQERAEVT